MNNLKPRRLVNLAIEEGDAPFMIHDEPVYRNGQRVGVTTSAAWGHRVKKSLAIADVSDEQGIDTEWIRKDEFEVEVATTRYPLSVRFNAYYDPNEGFRYCNMIVRQCKYRVSLPNDEKHKNLHRNHSTDSDILALFNHV